MEWVSKRERLAVGLYATAVFVLALLLLAVPIRAFAADIELPVPMAVVYPGQPVADKGVSLAKFRVPAAKLADYAVEESMLSGRVAKRTLLPNRPILLSDLKSPDVVRAGVPVPIVYREAGVFISGLGTPLASAGPGDAIRVRNTDSGITVSGIVQADGSIEVAAQ
ncbi:flagellar basal body P-ring formation chaperone FlgA [Aureimonas leprariae]|uniref:Flagella basal body P-ring formation protein FlgA n=1 Tax=Plantimonas leprariae TaxID=2615207 RepID=A0A7V7PKM5_9HYPH|nr:flagellar basal body P-ring formation chaperone FlgA [Aureimonas leprariae]KAB0676520.1 flagellar basal body P-ring formation protein FlgA [Aureimonas leprariae]